MANFTTSQQLQQYLSKVDHHEIYKLHMAQAKQTRKMFDNDPEMLAKVSAIEEKIKQTYRQACLKEQA